MPLESSENPITSSPEKPGENKEKENQFKPEFEIASVEEVRGLNELTLLRRIADSSWGREGNIDKEINNLSKDERSEAGDRFNVFMKKSNEEALEWVAFAKDKSEQVKEKTIEQLVKHKGFKKEEAEKFFGDFIILLDDVNKRHPELVENLNKKTELDKRLKEGKSEQIKEYLDKAVDFFNPKKETTGMQRIHLLPNNPVIPGVGGFSINMGDDIYIRSNNLKEGGINYVNIVHETLHPVINPITEKIKLGKQEKERIKDLVSYRLGNDPGYKNNADVLLNESLIRAYGLQFGGEKQNSLVSFKKEVENMNEKAYKEVVAKAKSMGMIFKSKTLEEFKGSELKEFYNKYIQDKLGDRIHDFYDNYAVRKKNEPDLHFEDYFLENYKELSK